MAAPVPSRSNNAQELEKILHELIPERPGSVGPRNSGTYSPTSRNSRPNSILGGSKLSLEQIDRDSSSPFRAAQVQTTSIATQALSTVPITTNYEFVPAPTPEVLSYNKGIQTSEPWSPPRANRSTDGFPDSDSDLSPSTARTPRGSKRLSRREREKDEALRQQLRREIEEELKALKGPVPDGPTPVAEPKFPARALTDEELNAVTSSNDFLDFVERSSKVIERALDQDYDILTNYALDGHEGVDNNENEAIREVAQFYDERWSKRRMISDMGFSAKVRYIDCLAGLH